MLTFFKRYSLLLFVVFASLLILACSNGNNDGSDTDADSISGQTETIESNDTLPSGGSTSSIDSVSKFDDKWIKLKFKWQVRKSMQARDGFVKFKFLADQTFLSDKIKLYTCAVTDEEDKIGGCIRLKDNDHNGSPSDREVKGKIGWVLRQDSIHQHFPQGLPDKDIILVPEIITANADERKAGHMATFRSFRVTIDGQSTPLYLNPSPPGRFEVALLKDAN